MRIAILCDAFIPENKAVSIRMHHLANAFQKQNVSVTVVTCTKPKAKFPFGVHRNICAAPSGDGSVVKRLLLEVLLGVELFFKIVTSRYDLVVISSPPFFSSFLAVIACKIRRISFVFDVRDEYPEVYFTAGLVKRTAFVGKILLFLEVFIYKNALLVISVTQGICERIGTKVEKEKIYLLRNGFDESIFKPAVQKDFKFSIVFHGNIGKFQNPELIVQLAKLVHEQQLDILFKVIGWGNNDAILKQVKLDNLHYYGMVEYEKIPAIISASHLGISFRTQDEISVNSFPVKLYEYIGVGLPMLVTPKSEAGDFIENRGMGFQFSGNDPSEILEKIKELYQNNELTQKLVENVLKQRHQFSRQQSTDALVEFLLQRIQKKND